MANWAWLAPKPRNAPHTGLLVRTATDSHVDGRARGTARWRGRRPARAPSCRPRRRRPESPIIRARSAGEAALGVAAGPVLHADRMALGVHEQALLAATACTSPGAARSQAASAVWAWLAMSSLPPNAPPLDTSSTVTRVAVDAEHRGDLVAVVPHALAAGVHVQVAAVGVDRARPAWTRARGRRARCAGSGRPRRTTWALAASAASTSPRRVLGHRTARCESVPHTAISGSSRAATGSVSGRQHVVVDLDQRGRAPGPAGGSRPRRWRGRRRGTTCARPRG